MNREKYINNTSYREGYADGYREGANAVVRVFEDSIRRFVCNFTELEDKLVELKTRIVELRDAESEEEE